MEIGPPIQICADLVISGDGRVVEFVSPTGCKPGVASRGSFYTRILFPVPWSMIVYLLAINVSAFPYFV